MSNGEGWLERVRPFCRGRGPLTGRFAVEGLFLAYMYIYMLRIRLFMRNKMITLCPTTYELSQKMPNFSAWVRRKLMHLHEMTAIKDQERENKPSLLTRKVGE